MKARKILSMIMALAMVISMMSVGVYAADGTEVSTYDELVDALATGGEVKLTADITAEGVVSATDANVDLNGHKLTLADNANNYFLGTSVIKNGTISIEGVEVDGDCIVGIGNRSGDGTLSLENVNVTGSNYSSAFAVFMIYGNGTLNVSGGEIELSNELSSAGGIFKNENGAGASGNIKITGTKINGDDISRGISGATVILDDVNMTLTGGDNGINGSKLTVKNSEINISGGTGRALTVTDYDVVIENSSLNFADNKEADIRFKTANVITTDDKTEIKECNVFADKEGAKINDKPVIGTEETPDTVTVAEGTTTVEEYQYPAFIGDKGFVSLDAALADLQDGDTLKIATGEYEGFDILVDNVTITGMTDDTVLTITSVPGNAFIGINAEGVSVENLTFVVSEGYEQTGDYLDGFDAVIGYWSNNFNAGSKVTTGYDVTGCTFINESTTMGVAMFNFSSFEIVGNTFENFNVGIHTMSDGSAMGTVKIEGNTFTKVNEPVNVYWGQKGEDNNSITITGNTFASAKDAEEIKVTVHDYASEVTGNAGIDAIDMSGNTFSAATEVVLVDAAADVSASVEETLTDVENVVLDNKYNAVARIGNNAYYSSLEAALAAAEEGAEIDLLGNTVVLAATLNADKNITIKNGTLDATDVEFEEFGVFVGAGEAITFEDVDFVLDDAKAHQGFFYNQGTVTFNGGSVVADGTDAPAIFHGGELETAGKFVINGTEITLSALVNGDEGGRGFLYPTLDIDDATITMTDLTDNAMRSVAGTVDNSIITVDGAEYGIKNKGFDGVLTVTNSEITITNTENGDDNVGIYLDTVDGLVADENSVINASIYVAPAEENGEPTIYYALVFAECDLPSVNEIAGTEIDLSEYVPTLDGYTFSGWYADAELKDEIDTVTLDENITVYAAWTKNRTSSTNGTSGGLQAGGDTSNKGADDLGQKDDADDKTDEQTPVTPAAHPFADVNSGDWYNAAVEYVYKNGLMNGTAEDEFSPNATLTRSMLVTVLYRAEGSPATNKSIPFGDVDMGAYYADAVIWAKQNGIVNGVTENNFAPNANITREQIAAIMHRYASYKGYNVAVAAELTGFADAKNVSAYAVDAMKYAVGAGIINGKTATTVNPAEFATRAELATILMRFIENNK